MNHIYFFRMVISCCTAGKSYNTFKFHLKSVPIIRIPFARLFQQKLVAQCRMLVQEEVAKIPTGSVFYHKILSMKRCIWSFGSGWLDFCSFHCHGLFFECALWYLTILGSPWLWQEQVWQMAKTWEGLCRKYFPSVCSEIGLFSHRLVKM